MDWTAVRDRYPGLERGVYLNSCSMGLPSKAVLAAQHRFQDQWSTLGASAWYDLWMGEATAWRSNIARLIGAKPSEIAWLPSVSVGLGSLAGALDRHNRSGGKYGKRNEVVIGELEFPTAVAGFGPRPETKLRFAKSPDGVHIPFETYAREMGHATQAVVASRVFFTTGAIQDVSSIVGAARHAGALGIVDDYQATGQLALDVHSMGLDVVVGGSLKWLCGGAACGWMYVKDSLVQDLEPTHSGWWANAAMWEFDNRRFRFWDDARRFEAGEMNIASIVTANAALKEFLAVGPSRIASRTQELARDLAERLEDAGCRLKIHPDRSRRSAILMVPRPDPHADVARMAKAGVIVDDRPGCVRFSPHFYNTEQDNERAVDALLGKAASSPDQAMAA
jgi:kynureninase